MPTHFFFKASDSFDIDYEIVSKNTQVRQTGTLHCTIPEEKDEARVEKAKHLVE